MQFHDLLIWDRAVGYNERYDSFTPCYEMILVLRKSKEARAYFDKDAIRTSYDENTIKQYLKDKRYKDLEARRKHLEKGKYASNILRVPSLKGSSKEKVGHPSQKPLKLIEMLVLSASREGDKILDPFLGSGTTAVVCQNLNRDFVGIEIEKEYIEIAEKRLKDAPINLFTQISTSV
jgi:site-specific DNA-methyltransferase (adenine-specific)